MATKKTVRSMYTSGARNKKLRAKQLVTDRELKRKDKNDTQSQSDALVGLLYEKDKATNNETYAPMAAVIDLPSPKCLSESSIDIIWEGPCADPMFRKAYQELLNLRHTGKVKRLTNKSAKLALKRIGFRGNFAQVFEYYRSMNKKESNDKRHKRGRLGKYHTFNSEKPIPYIDADGYAPRKIRRQLRVAFVDKQIKGELDINPDNSKRNLKGSLSKSARLRSAITESFKKYPDNPLWARSYQSRLRQPIPKSGSIKLIKERPSAQGEVRRMRKIDAHRVDGRINKRRLALPGAI